MSKALEILDADFTPTPLQAAAITRIGELKEELARYGLYPRTSMELEFFVETDAGAEVKGVINLAKATKFLKEDQGIALLDKFETEGIEARRHGRHHLASQYEATVDDIAGYKPALIGMRPDFKPEQVAFSVEKLRTRSIRELLRTTTCLNPMAGVGLLGELLPNFAARPYEHRPAETSGLHVNVSLIDREGKNVFARSLPLLYHCADGVAAAQKAATLAMLPTAQSVKRLGANQSAPDGFGVKIGSFTIGRDYGSSTIRSLEMAEGAAHPRGNDQTRIENRLPGADADPFVAMAVTLAGVVEAVREHMHVRRSESNPQKLRVKVDPSERPSFPKSDIPRDHEALQTQFAHSNRARTMLGPALYEAVTRAYGKTAER